MDDRHIVYMRTGNQIVVIYSIVIHKDNVIYRIDMSDLLPINFTLQINIPGDTPSIASTSC